jgi:hypothetical protein
VTRRRCASSESSTSPALTCWPPSSADYRAAGRLGRRTVRQRVERWEAAGWAVRRRMLDHTWVLPTRAGMRLAGLELDSWTPALDRLAHHHAAAVVRLHREPIPGEGGWVSERELWHRRGTASWHLADGALPAPVPTGWQGIDQAWELVEVELHQKARTRVLAALKTRPPHTAQVTYYVPAALHTGLTEQLASVVRELGGRPSVAVELLPQVPGITYLPAGGMQHELASRGPTELGRLGAARPPLGTAPAYLGLGASRPAAVRQPARPPPPIRRPPSSRRAVRAGRPWAVSA